MYQHIECGFKLCNSEIVPWYIENVACTTQIVTRNLQNNP